MFGSLGAPELLIIGLIVILLFGVGKISGLGKDLGTSVKEFRKAVKDEDEKPAVVVQQMPAQQLPQAAPPPPPAPAPQAEQKNPNIF